MYFPPQFFGNKLSFHQLKQNCETKLHIDEHPEISIIQAAHQDAKNKIFRENSTIIIVRSHEKLLQVKIDEHVLTDLC